MPPMCLGSRCRGEGTFFQPPGLPSLEGSLQKLSDHSHLESQSPLSRGWTQASASPVCHSTDSEKAAPEASAGSVGSVTALPRTTDLGDGDHWAIPEQHLLGRQKATA